MREKVFVTGGTGFIGRFLVDYLYRAGYEVFVLVREDSDVSFLKKMKVNLVKGDLSEPESFSSRIEGIKGFFHLGGVVSAGEKKKNFEKINVVSISG